MYVPNYSDGQCAYLYSDNFIRVYDETPRANSTIQYTDYLLSHHYLSRRGTTTFSSYSTLPTCSSDVTTNFYHRVDITDIVLLATIFIGWTWFLVSKLVKTLLRGGRIW